MHEAPTPPAASSLEVPTSPIAPWWHTALLAALLIGVSVTSAHRVHGPGLSSGHIARYLTGIASEAALLLLTWWGLRLRNVSFSAILGFRRGALARDFGAAGVFWLAALLILAIIAGLLRLA